MFEVTSAWKAAQVIDMVVPQLKAQGFGFVTIEQMRSRKEDHREAK